MNKYNLLKYFKIYIATIFILSSSISYSQNNYNKGDYYVLDTIVVSGLKNFSDKTVVAYSGLRKGQNIQVPGEEISNVLKKLWNLELFSDVNIFISDIKGKSAKLEISVDELPTLNNYKINGIKKGQSESIIKETELSQGKRVQKVSFEIKSGEVVGLTGLVGAGRTETARLLFGAETKDSGDIELDGKLLSIKNPRDAIQQNICLLTEDRKSQGLILTQTIRENFSLPNLLQFCSWGFIQKKDESEALSFYVDQIKMKITSTEQMANTLSGGNQQKVVLSKWLQRNAEVIIFDEPTRGIDVGAKYEIYQLINQLTKKGKAILMISSELPEILGMSDRVLVMNEGHITGEIQNPSNATQEDVMRLATKSKPTSA